MFLTHFSMTDHPFIENPPKDWLLTDDRFNQALARLQFFQQQGNLALIIGQTGIGKSSLLRLFMQTIPQNQYRPIYIHLTNISPGAFLRMIVTQLGESPKLGKDRLFLQIAERVQKNETQTVLIIDEAHLVPSQALTDLRLLVSSGIDKPSKQPMSRLQRMSRIDRSRLNVAACNPMMFSSCAAGPNWIG